MISIICPTIAGREEHYERCESAYEIATWGEFEWIKILDEPTCGLAWQKGAEQATGDYLHFTADDLEPSLDWDAHAVAASDNGFLPAPIIYNGHTRDIEQMGVQPDGFFTRIPFCSRAQWEKIGPMLPIHYYTDNWVSWRGKQAGIETMEVPGYEFLHYWAQQGRLDGRMSEDFYAYERAKGAYS